MTTLAATTTLRYLSVRQPLQEQGGWRLRITASVRRIAPLKAHIGRYLNEGDKQFQGYQKLIRGCKNSKVI